MKTQTKINIKSAAILTVLVFTFCLSLCFSTVKMTAYADNGDFTIDAQMHSSNDETYDISVTVENRGEDWEGIVRVKFEGSYDEYTNCAYDTAISLPQGSVKQFEVKLPKYIGYSYSYGGINGNIGIFLLDKNSKPVFSQKFDKLLFEEKDVLNMGILSDDYSSLTFMDMGGEKVKYYGSSYPIRLVELNQDNLSDLLYSLDFLVIDKYDTGILASDVVEDIEKWNNKGGVLIVGAGKYAEDVLAGLDYLDVEYKNMYSEEDNPYTLLSWINMDEINIAELDFPPSSYHVDSYIAALLRSEGNGAVGVLMYSLSELGGLGDDAYNYTYNIYNYGTQDDFAYSMLDNISSYADKRYNSTTLSNSNLSNINGRFLSGIGNGNNSLSFGLLKFIIVIYVIIVGPVLYLILRFLKKRDSYWVAVPALSLIGIILVMFAGRGLEIVRTKVFSVTACDLSNPDDCVTYMHCYDANHKEWDLRLSQGYEYAAPTSAHSLADDTDYDYLVLKEGERLFFGADPDTGFQDVYFYAGKNADVQNIGSIEFDASFYNTTVHKVANNTGYDFEYLAVLNEDDLWVYEGLAAGDTCSPVKMKAIFTIDMDDYYYSYYYYLSEAQEALKTGNLDAIAALGIGINSAYYNLGIGDIAVVGVTSDYIKAVDDNCSEEAYGCFYIIQKF